MTKFEKFIRLLTAISTFLLVGVGIWYTWETRGLKLQSQDQLAEMRRQFRIVNVPALYASVVHKNTVKELIDEGKLLQASGKRKYSKKEFSEVLKFMVRLENVTDKIAHNVCAYIFDIDTKSYLKSPQGVEWVKRGDTPQVLYFFAERDNYIQSNQLIKEVNRHYQLNLNTLNTYIDKQELNMMLLFFEDIEGNTYLRTRQFTYDAQNTRKQGKTILFELEQCR